jgi:hypothetical protein
MGAVKNHRRRSSLYRVFEDLIEAEWQRMKNPPPAPMPAAPQVTPIGPMPHNSATPFFAPPYPYYFAAPQAPQQPQQ